MNRQIRIVAGVVLVGFFALFVQLNYWQVVASNRLRADPRNPRLLIKEFAIQRGQMIAGTNDVVAESLPTNGALKYLRRYPQGSLYAFATGYYSIVYGRSGLEQAFNTYLLGQAPEQFARNLIDLITEKDRAGDTLLLTLDPATQAAAARALGPHKGAVVAIDPTTGAILALVSYPSYDPNALSSHDTATIRAAWTSYLHDPNQPLLDRGLQQLYPPGSSFKIITSASALENGYTPSSTFPNSTSYRPPQTSSAIHNFGGEICYGGVQPVSLTEAFEASCNAVYARLGVELGASKLVATAEQFGLNRAPAFTQLPTAPSLIPASMNPPETAQAAIGQFNDRVTPLQMAEVAATVANGGVLHSPYIVRQVLAQDGSVIQDYSGQPGRRVLSAQVAAELTGMMAQVVNGPYGTGHAAQIPGVQVYGKTGTAQHGVGQPPDSWFVCFASSGGRSIAVAALVENGGSLGGDGTGGLVAAPIARQVIQAYLQGGG